MAAERRPAWGHGYATEAALAALEYGFDIMGLPEIVAVTMARNLRYIRAQKINKIPRGWANT